MRRLAGKPTHQRRQSAAFVFGISFVLARLRWRSIVSPLATTPSGEHEDPGVSRGIGHICRWPPILDADAVAPGMFRSYS
jgi:hypothetical protein